MVGGIAMCLRTLYFAMPASRSTNYLFLVYNSPNFRSLRFDSTKGYGFIMPDDDSGDVFVHQTSIKVEGFRSLDENQRVEFRVETDKNGKSKAMDVVSAP